MENQQCESAFPGSRPATLAEILHGIVGLPETTGLNYLRFAAGKGSYSDANIRDGAWYDSAERMMGLKSWGWIRICLDLNFRFTDISEPVYSTQPYDHTPDWYESYKLGNSGFRWENISRGLPGSNVLCVKDPGKEPICQFFLQVFLLFC